MIRELIEKWRENEVYIHASENADIYLGGKHARNICADELQAALPTWTRITDDESTWPEKGQDVLIYLGSGFLEKGGWGVSPNNMQHYIDRGYYWRSTCDLDTPPKVQA